MLRGGGDVICSICCCCLVRLDQREFEALDTFMSASTSSKVDIRKGERSRCSADGAAVALLPPAVFTASLAPTTRLCPTIAILPRCKAVRICKSLVRVNG